MNKMLTTTAVLAAITAGGAASAQGMDGGFYYSLFGGFSVEEFEAALSADTDYKYTFESESGYVLGGTFGRSLSGGMRAELEASYAGYSTGTITYQRPGLTYSGDVSSYDIGTSAFYLLGNVWYDVPVGGAGVTPYVGGGIGGAALTLDIEGDLGETGSLAYQFGGGVQVPLGTAVLDIGYRYKGYTGGGLFIDLNEFDISGSSNHLQVGYVMAF